ncbi:Tetratricopeptide repeat domain protein [Balamuthia mandrillaris]
MEERRSQQPPSSGVMTLAERLERYVLHPTRFPLSAECTESASEGSLARQVSDLCQHIAESRYEQAVASPLVASFFAPTDEEVSEEQIKERVNNWLAHHKAEEEELLSQLAILLSGIAALQVFMQANWTGPELPPSLRGEEKPLSKEKKERVLADLSMDGESVYPHTRYIRYLAVACYLLLRSSSAFSALKSGGWWKARCMRAWQMVLSGPAATLCDGIEEAFSSVMSVYASFDDELHAMAELEIGLAWLHYSQSKKAKTHLKRAQEKSGLQVQLTGALGKRTKFQTFNTAQLVLHATSKDSSTENEKEKQTEVKEEGESSSSSTVAPREVENLDDVLLPETQFESNEEEEGEEAAKERKKKEEGNLAVLDQCILLALCGEKYLSSPKDALTREEIMPYVVRVQKNPNNWMVHSTCLLLKSKLEAHMRRTADRAVLQLQVLEEQFFSDESEASLMERSKYVWQVAYPPRHMLRRELGERFLSLGAAASALKLFEGLEMWDQIIICYRVMEKTSKAERIVRERLDASPTAELWCILGELTGDISHFETAWQFSNKRYARAQRLLGHYYLKQQQWSKCMESYELALAINPLYHECWFSLGCAAMQLQEWEKALTAFGRVVQLDYNQHEAWNNLASVYIRQNKHQQAFHALSEGLKCAYDNWRMWENYLYLCLELDDYHQALHALTRLVELEHPLDIKATAVLVDVALKLQSESMHRKAMIEKLESIFKKITATVTNDPKVWAVYAVLLYGIGQKHKALDCRLKQMRAARTADCFEDDDKFKTAATASVELAQLYMDIAATEESEAKEKKKHLYSAKLNLTGMIKKAEERFGNTEAYAKMEATLQEVKNMEASLP